MNPGERSKRLNEIEKALGADSSSTPKHEFLPLLAEWMGLAHDELADLRHLSKPCDSLD